MPILRIQVENQPSVGGSFTVVVDALDEPLTRSDFKFSEGIFDFQQNIMPNAATLMVTFTIFGAGANVDPPAGQCRVCYPYTAAPVPIPAPPPGTPPPPVPWLQPLLDAEIHKSDGVSKTETHTYNI
jgi:hypothetical protein